MEIGEEGEELEPLLLLMEVMMSRAQDFKALPTPEAALLLRPFGPAEPFPFGEQNLWELPRLLK